jgi:hypothetical protein
MDCRVAIMSAASENMPINAPFGSKIKCIKAIQNALAQTICAGFPNGMKAGAEIIVSVIEAEISSYSKREDKQQFVTGTHLGESTAELDSFCLSAKVELAENVRISKLSTAEKEKLLEERTEHKKEADSAREAAAEGLDQRTMDSRKSAGKRRSPEERPQSPLEVFTYGSSSSSGEKPDSNGAIDKLVDHLVSESKDKKEHDDKKEERLKSEGLSASLLADKKENARAEEASKELAIKAEQATAETNISLKRLGTEADAEARLRSSAEEESKRLKLTAEADAYATRAMADANAGAVNANAETARLTAQAALEKGRAEAAAAKANSDMMMAFMNHMKEMKRGGPE